MHGLFRVLDLDLFLDLDLVLPSPMSELNADC